MVFIYKAHYVMFGFGCSSVIVLLTLFLRTYAPETSFSEVGLLLMFLPFLSTIVKPLFGALADRQQAHKQYLMAMLALEALGFGIMVTPTFFPDFIGQHGRLVWYFYAFWIVIGYSAYSVIYSLGDALAIDAAAKSNTPWGSIRAYGTASWGIGGWCIGFVNESPYMPAYVPGLLINSIVLVLQILLFYFWPYNEDFDMSHKQPSIEPQASQLDTCGLPQTDATGSSLAIIDMQERGENRKQQLQQQLSTEGSESRKGTLTRAMMQDFAGGASYSRASCSSLSPRMVAAIGKLVVEGIGTSSRMSKDSTSRGGRSSRQRPALAELIGQEEVTRMRSRANSRSSMRSRQATLTSVSPRQPLRLVHEATLNRSKSHDPESPDQPKVQAAAGVTDSKQQAHSELSVALQSELELQLKPEVGQEEKPMDIESLQLVLLKIIMRRNPGIIKNLLIFTLMGMLLYIHIVYFFMHAEIQCRILGLDFSEVAGYYLLAHTFSEVFTFLVVTRYYMPFVGRTGSFVTAGFVFLFRYSYYATYFTHYSPYWAIITEWAHGFAYGIVYTLMSELSRESVDQLDEYMPELIDLGLTSPGLDPDQLKVPLRATMHGIFSGAFDGLGNGLGVVVAGICLDYYSFQALWIICSIMSIILIVSYPLTEMRSIFKLDASTQSSAGQTVATRSG